MAGLLNTLTRLVRRHVPESFDDEDIRVSKRRRIEAAQARLDAADEERMELSHVISVNQHGLQVSTSLLKKRLNMKYYIKLLLILKPSHDVRTYSQCAHLV